MANEAYRAVFLRVHPTGKMALSLTTDTERFGEGPGYTFGSGELPPGDEGFLDGQAVYTN